MELGDRVYAAERIMKKRVRKVIVIKIRFIILLNCFDLLFAKEIGIQLPTSSY